MSDLGDSYRELREEGQKHRKKKQNDNTEIVLHLAGEYGFDVKIIQEYHLRLGHPGGRPLDYFPQKGSATWLGTNRWFKIKDIEAFIEENWEKHEPMCMECRGSGEGPADGTKCIRCKGRGTLRVEKEFREPD